MKWINVIKRMAPYVIRIETPNGHGTGFLLTINDNPPMYSIATARHVIDHAAKWKLPIMIYTHKEQKAILYEHDDYMVLMDPSERDLAILLIGQRSLKFDGSPPDLIPANHYLTTGVNVGWLGYPFPSSFGLNFFSGHISGSVGTFGQHDHAYLIDGVAINGVSGGPLLIVDETYNIQIAGLISAYYPNRATGEALPGLSIAQDSSSLHGGVHYANNLKLYADPKISPAKPMYDRA